MMERPEHGTAPLPEIIRLRFMLAGLILSILVLTIYGFSTGNRFILLALGLAPIGVLLVNRVNAWFVIVIGLYYSWIYVPGFPMAMSLFHTMAIGIVPVMIARRCLRPAPRHADKVLNGALFALLGVLLVTMKVRGVGLRFMGGEVWGGAVYVHVIAVILFFLACDAIELTERQCRVALILFFTAGLLPSLAEIVYLHSRGSFYYLYYFIKPEGSSATGNLEVLSTGIGIVRYQVSKFGMFIFVLMTALYPPRGRRLWVIVGGMLLSFFFAGVSGHRGAMLYLVLFIPILILMTKPRAVVYLMFSYAGIFFVAAALLHFFGTALPLAHQRALSWMPFADIAPAARWSADVTTTWRLDLWARVMEMLPKYLLIGRGFGFSALELSSQEVLMQGDVATAIVSHNYHSGPLALLLDLGVPGFVSATIFLLYGLVRHVRLMRQEWHSQGLARCHRVLLASLTTDVLQFYIFYGDLDIIFIGFIVQFALLEAMVRTQRGLARAASGRVGAVPSYV